MNATIDIVPNGRYTTRKASAALGCSEGYLRRCARENRLPRYMPLRGRPYYFGRDLIKLWKGEI